MRLLAEPTDLGVAYRVDLRLRPAGQSGPIANQLRRGDCTTTTSPAAPGNGRRSSRPGRSPAIWSWVANCSAELEPWIYRRYLSRADITGIKALKRRIEQRSDREGADNRNVKTGHGGIRDIEFAIQFLQLLNGGDLPALRTGNTLEAIAQLENCGCLTHQERTLLEDSYSFLRKIEHRLQIMFDLQTHTLPDDPREAAQGGHPAGL